MKARLALALLLLAALALLPGPAAAEGHWDMVALSPEARAIALKIQCPICEGQSIAESNATIAKQMKAVVQEKVEAGWSERQVLDYFRERYGEIVLREPPRSGLTLGVWLVPPMVLLAGLALVALLVRGWRRSPPVEELPQASDEEAVVRALRQIGREEGR